MHLNPEWVPAYLKHCFDENFDAYTPVIDLENLDLYMQYLGAKYKKLTSELGATELTAEGYSAEALAGWLATTFAKGARASRN